MSSNFGAAIGELVVDAEARPDDADADGKPLKTPLKTPLCRHGYAQRPQTSQRSIWRATAMNWKATFLIACSLAPLSAFAQGAQSLVREGKRAYDNKQYAECSRSEHTVAHFLSLTARPRSNAQWSPHQSSGAANRIEHT